MTYQVPVLNVYFGSRKLNLITVQVEVVFSAFTFVIVTVDLSILFTVAIQDHVFQAESIK